MALHEPPAGFQLQLFRDGISMSGNQPDRLSCVSAVMSEPLPKGGNLVAIPTDLRAAPAAPVRFRLVYEPKDASLALTSFDEPEIRRGKKHGRRFSDGS